MATLDTILKQLEELAKIDRKVISDLYLAVVGKQPKKRRIPSRVAQE